MSLAFAVVGVVLAVLSGRIYVASASFVLQGADTRLGQLASLAGQLGVSPPASDAGGQSPAFYADLLRSREVLRPVAEARYDVAGAEMGSDEAVPILRGLPELLEIEDDSRELETMEAMRWLREKAVHVETDAETGMVSVSVESPWAGLSYAIASRLVTLVNQFNLETRQSRAAAERVFIEERLAEGEDSLLAAEDRLEGFLQSNRLFENSPELLFQHDRLQRQVARHQQVVTSLAQAYEEARVDEVRNTPVITVVEPPELPLLPEPRGTLLKAVLGLVLGGMVGLFWAFCEELLHRERDVDSEAYREFSRLWTGTWQDVRTLGRRRR